MMEINYKMFSLIINTQKNKKQPCSVRGTPLFFFSSSSYNIKIKIFSLLFSKFWS